MIVSEEFQIRAPCQAVWDYFMDVNKVAACMPGVQSVEPLGNDTYRVAVGVKVGPIKADFSGQVAVLDKRPPAGFRVTADWKDRNTTSKTTVGADVELEDAGDGLVTCRLKADVAILGVLGKYGQGVAEKKAAEIRESFAACVRQALEPAPEVTPAAEPVAAAAPAAVPVAPARPSLWARIVAFFRRLFARRA